MPSVAVLADRSRWSLVLFLDGLTADLTRYTRTTFDRAVRVRP
ncbi:MAG TPA: hypothetical protein VKV73_13275 [Chloroflexota bacterium]|nr:hypothetical protein [Chloroflexota bacterium]